MSIWNGMEDRIKQFLFFGFVSAIGLSIAGTVPSVTVITIGLFISMFLIPFGNTASQAIWQRKVDPNVQGRVFALRRMVAMSLSPIAYITAGPVVDKVFNPLMAEGGLLAGSLGQIIGFGEGRGIGLLFITLGLLWATLSVCCYLYPRIRLLEAELPDAVIETESGKKTTIVKDSVVSAEV